jgi:CheY-like chemotaxis protein
MKVMRILLVDDEAEIRRLLARRLSRRGYAVTTASDGDQALALLAEGAYDLAILDFMMPGMNGLELAAQCSFLYPHLKVLMLTGSPVISEIEVARYPCLRKPLENLEDLDQTVGRVLRGEAGDPKVGSGR